VRVVGGLERAFVIDRNSRNDGIDSAHSAELPMMAAYLAYADLARELIQRAAVAVSGSPKVIHHDGTESDLAGEWPDVTLFGSLSEALGEEVTVRTPLVRPAELAGAHGVPVDLKWGLGKLAQDIFGALPGRDPAAAHPRVRRPGPDGSADPRAPRGGAARTGGICTSGESSRLPPTRSRSMPWYSTERLVAQALLGAKGDPEAMALDDDFRLAMQYGMPPCGGMGMGAARLLIALTGLGIRETITFPLVRPE
jgi:lysyl-tRNA synthetase class 2